MRNVTKPMNVTKPVLAALLTTMIFCLPAGAGMAKEKIAYEVDGKPFEGYMASPAVGKAPFILLIHDWDGLTDYEEKRADMLATLGYAVFCADLYGAGVRPTAIADKQRHTAALYQNRQQMRSLLYGALAAAKSKGADIDNAVAMGYCFGGAAVLELARSGANLKGFVTFHGGLETPDGQDYGKSKGKFLIFHGTADESVGMDQFAALAVALEKNGISHEMITYGGAPHAFTVFGTDRYRKDADRKSWNRFTEFLAETLDR